MRRRCTRSWASNPPIRAARWCANAPAEEGDAMRRRRFLKGMLGGGAVLGATQLVNAPIAKAGTDGDVVLGDVNNASAQTSIVATGATALHLEADSNFSLYAVPKTGSSADVIAVYGLGQGLG